MNTPDTVTWVLGERGGRNIGRYEALFESPEEFETFCERLRLDLPPETLLYDLHADPTLRITEPAAETCSRHSCGNPTRYVLVHKGVSYPICASCIEDFEFWQKGDFDGPVPEGAGRGE